jgi:hypothetical protein
MAFGLIILVLIVNISLALILSPKIGGDDFVVADAPSNIEVDEKIADVSNEIINDILQNEQAEITTRPDFVTEREKELLMKQLMKSPYHMPQESRMAGQGEEY